MNVKMVRYKVGGALDVLLGADVGVRKKEPRLPNEDEDRTDWLLWCTEKHNCTMDEANKKYWLDRAQMTLLAKNIRSHRKV